MSKKATDKDQLDAAAFRKELVKIMPGYTWTVHKPYIKPATYLKATGIQTSGFNRLSTLQVIKRKRGRDEAIEYEVKSSGYGKSAPWLGESTLSTLAQALRALQEHYEYKARLYRGLECDLKIGRIAPVT